MGRAIKFKDETYICPYFPIGSIYMNISDINPSKYFGGVWEKIQNAFLFGASDKHPAGEVGGEETHLLSNEEMPRHKHTQGFRWTTEPGANAVYGSNATGSGADYDDRMWQGGNQAHNNMPPYFAVYIWKRTA